MGKVTRTTISFDKEFLRKLNEDANSSVQIVKGVKRLPIRPFQLADINASVKDILQKQIAKYDQGLGGILLGYQNAHVLASDPFTFDSSFTHLDIGAEFYMFKPERGNILTGVINKKSKDHVGCLVYDTFNASLPKPNDDDSWLGHKAQIGNEVKFRITFTDLESRLPYIRGEIESIACDDSGFSTEDGIPQNTIIKFSESDDEQPDLSRKLKEREGTKSSKRKKRKNTEVDTSANVELDDNKIVKSKKKKRLRNISPDNIEECEGDVDEDRDASNVIRKHKKKKRKHSRSDMSGEMDEEPSKLKKGDVDEESRSKHKKHKRKNLQEECSEEVINVSSSQRKKSKKKEKLEETSDNPDEYLEIKKKKKKDKNKSYDMSVDDCPEDDNIDEEGCKNKKKKHKHKSRESDPYDQEAQLSECARKEKKHKKKKKTTEDIF